MHFWIESYPVFSVRKWKKIGDEDEILSPHLLQKQILGVGRSVQKNLVTTLPGSMTRSF